ncbi:MAG TPA: globin domain-containing protein [Nitrospiria bacterium]|nr:globin domain-containing protein [Nitrospiria bacterium]
MTEPKDSYERCAATSKFMDLFYERFLASDPRIKPLFKKTDWDLQKNLLKTGIRLMILLEEEHPESHHSLKRIGKTHGKEKLNIDPALYPFWKKSLMETIRELDPQFSPEIERAWNRVIDSGLKFIASHH